MDDLSYGIDWILSVHWTDRAWRLYDRLGYEPGWMTQWILTDRKTLDRLSAMKAKRIGIRGSRIY